MKLILLLTLFVIGLSLYIWRNITSKIAKNNVLNQFKKASKNSDFANSLCDLLEISYLKLDCESINFNTIYEKLIGLQSENYKIVDLIKLENKYLIFTTCRYKELDHGIFSVPELVVKEKNQLFLLRFNAIEKQINFSGELYFDKLDKSRIENFCEKIKNALS